MNTRRLQSIAEKYQLPSFRVRQLQHAFFQEYCTSFEEITTLPKDLRRQLQEEESILCFKKVDYFGSAQKDTWKARITLRDGTIIESVMIRPKPDYWSICVSTQVGCKLGCVFCTTGTICFQRNLSEEEITDQVLLWKQFAKNNLQVDPKNVVYMGMGEPFLNLEATLTSLRELTSPESFDIGDRHLSVSTAGIIPGIEKLAEAFPQINLSISLHAATNELRDQLVPINRKYPLEELQIAIDHYLRQTNRKVFIEYVMLADVNDHWEDMQALITWLDGISLRHLLHVNFIPYHPGKSKQSFLSSSYRRMQKCREILKKAGYQVTIRKSLGVDIGGACGQLAGK